MYVYTCNVSALQIRHNKAQTYTQICKNTRLHKHFTFTKACPQNLLQTAAISYYSSCHVLIYLHNFIHNCTVNTTTHTLDRDKLVSYKCLVRNTSWFCPPGKRLKKSPHISSKVTAPVTFLWKFKSMVYFYFS